MFDAKISVFEFFSLLRRPKENSSKRQIVPEVHRNKRELANLNQSNIISSKRLHNKRVL